MDEERAMLLKQHMKEMDEEMSMLAMKFKLTNASDIIAMYQTYLVFKMERYQR